MPASAVNANSIITSARQPPPTALPATRIFKQRRSAQGFDRNATLPRAQFYRMLDALLPRNICPWDAGIWRKNAVPRVHAAIFAHRVQDLAAGIYLLPRAPAAQTQLRAQLHQDFLWMTPPGCPETLPLYLLAQGDARAMQRLVNCQQAIAADSAFTVALLAEFDATLDAAPEHYRRLFQEAGLIGHALYLEAEAEAVRGTGIGCFFDDACHEVLGIQNTTFQSLYHFTVGTPLIDTRIATLPAYPQHSTETTTS